MHRHVEVWLAIASLYQQMHLMQSRNTFGGDSPTVHRIGGSDWVKSKARAKKAIRDIAKELIKVYAARVSMPGYAFSPDTTWQRELEDAFAYVETPDQISTIEEVKRDMESDRPMVSSCLRRCGIWKNRDSSSRCIQSSSGW